MKVRQNYSFYRKLNEGVNEYDNRINALPIQHIGYAYFSSVNYNADRNQFALYPVWNGSINSMLEDPLPEGGFKIDVTVNEAADLGVTDLETLTTINHILDKFAFPQVEYDYKEYLPLVVYDKKNIAGVVNFIFVTKLGECIIYPIKEEDIKEKANECNN